MLIFKIFFIKWKKETLIPPYKFYCNKELIGAHSAESDTKATYEILKAQVEKYDDLENNISFLSEFSQEVSLLIWLDL